MIPGASVAAFYIQIPRNQIHQTIAIVETWCHVEMLIGRKA
jgi:hypothetical protein